MTRETITTGNKMCRECYSDESRKTPLLNPRECLESHTQYICGTCGRCICIERAPKSGLRRFDFPFKSCENARLYLRTADYCAKKPCGIYEVSYINGRVSYRIFADEEQRLRYIIKNAGKATVGETPVFSAGEYKEYADTQVRKLTRDEAQKYADEQLCANG